MANIWFMACSCFVFAGHFIFAQSHLFAFPLETNFSMQGFASFGSLLPPLSNHQIITHAVLSKGDESQATFAWMTYNQPISLWEDNSSSFLANFSSHFRFQVYTSDYESYNYGDGVTFFLVPFDSEPSVNCTGQWLGLFNHTTDGDSSNQIVAVEFDTFKNDPFDPDDNHVGINVNSIVSKAYVSFLSDLGIIIRKASHLDAWISYDGIAKRLHVFLTTNKQKPETPILSYDIDLAKFLPQKIKVGISASTSARSLDQYFLYSWDFDSFHCDASKKNNYGLIISVFACLLAVVGFALFVWLCYWRSRSRTEEEDIEMDKWFSEGPRKFSYAELGAATHNFRHEERLGGGGFGDVYRGVLLGTKEPVAVKRISHCSKQGKKEYVSEVTIISKLRHRNLVQLLGWSHCIQKGELLLVYEFLPNGSLDKYIFSDTACLDWEQRYVIVCDIAAALVYLHEDCKERVVHRDVKTGNIMLDSEYRAKLGDFGLARLTTGDFGNGKSTVVAGTVGYIAPECVVSCKPNSEWDVFSFGAVCLEIACGRRVVDSCLEDYGWRLVEWVWDLHSQGKILTVADEKLNDNYDANEMERVLMLGLLCSHPHPKARPSMRKVMHILRLVAEMPNVPLTYPVTMYGGTVGPLEIPAFPMYGKISTPTN